MPIHSGLVRWATIGYSPGNVPDLIQPTEDFFISFSACGGVFVPEFQDNTTCISYTGGASIETRGQGPEAITMQSATVRGNQHRGYDVSSEVEAFHRAPALAHNLVQLNHYWSAERRDLVMAPVDSVSARDHLNTRYTLLRSEPVYVFRTQKPGTVPLNLDWSWDRYDNAHAVEGSDTERDLLRSNYSFIRTDRYVRTTP